MHYQIKSKSFPPQTENLYETLRQVQVNPYLLPLSTLTLFRLGKRKCDIYLVDLSPAMAGVTLVLRPHLQR